MAVNRLPIGMRGFFGERRLTVLGGDPDPAVMSLLRELTPPDMYRVEETVEPAEFSELLRWFDVVLAVVDVGLLKRDERLRGYLACRSRLGLPVIVTAEQPDVSDEMLARRLGCVLYAPKPVGFWLIQQAVTGLLCKPAGKRLGI